MTNNPAATKQGSKRKDGDKKRKARKSLCHVESPTIVQRDLVVPPLLPPAVDESHPNTAESDIRKEIVNKPLAAAKASICFDDDDDDDNDETTRQRNFSSRSGSRGRI